jgi:ribonuclease-3
MPDDEHPDLAALQSELGYEFKDISLLELALTHPSYAQESGRPGRHNQRLEFLGDAVLQLALTAKLYDQFPDHEEGPLTKARAQMVKQQTLFERGRTLDLGARLLLSRGEDRNQGRRRSSNLADAYEALLGAVFLDGGFEAASRVILAQFSDDMADVDSAPNLDNPKGELQEFLQGRSQPSPEYRLIDASGPDHDKVFKCAVLHEGREIGSGTGKSKKIAESEAARAALETLRDGETESAEPPSDP